MFCVANFSDGRTTTEMNLAHLTRTQSQRCIGAFARNELRIGAGRTRHLAALARLHLDVVDDRTDRDRLQRQGR